MDSWVIGEKCRRKGGASMITYYVAETSDTGVRLQVIRSGRAQGIGRWHSWKIMEMDFTPSAKKLGKITWYGHGTEESKR